MPLIENSTCSLPQLLKNRHIQSVLPSVLRRVPTMYTNRERIETPDGDFLDIDWVRNRSYSCVVILHGLEGHARRSYIKGMVRVMRNTGWDCAAVNMRGCSGEPNRLPKSYHQGSSDDLATVVTHVSKSEYKRIALIGFSLGGNIILKYLGEGLWEIPSSVVAAAAVSTPCDLTGCAEKLSEPSNAFYMKRFLKMLKSKLEEKRKLFPDRIDLDGYEKLYRFKEFDDRYTAPLSGFANAEDYWEKCSSLQFLPNIGIPTLMISAFDDPFLTPSCFPREIAEKHPYLTLEITDNGGHVGFMGYNVHGTYWHELRIREFIQRQIETINS